MKQYIIAVFALMGLLLIGSAFATQDLAASVQATHLQLRIDEALTVGANVIAKIEANNTNNVSTTQLQAILDQLINAKNSIDVNATTVEEVQETREQVKELVKSFRDTTKDLLGDDVKAEIKAKADKEFKAKFEQKIRMGDEMQKQFNLKALERFAERQQHDALNLSDDENVSLTPEFAAKIADIRAKIEANKVSRDEIAQMRTQIKVNAQGLKSERESLVADIRVNVLEHRAEMLEQIIAYAQEKNASTTELVYAHAKVIALLDSYSAGNMSADAFAKDADVIHKSIVGLLNNEANSELHAEIKLRTADDRVELREENKATMEAWREERKQIIEDLREGNKLRLEMRKELKDNRSESRLEVRNADGSRLEIRERMKDGVLETRIRERAADSEDSSDDVESENESNDLNEVEDESEDESSDESN